MADADTTRPRAQSDTIHIRCRGAKSFVDDLGQSRGVVLSRAVHFCDLLRLSRTTRRFVRFRRTRLRRTTFRPVRDFRLEILRSFIAEGSAPGDFFQSPSDCGSPDCGCSDFADFPSRSSIERFARCGTFALKFFGVSLLKVPRRAIFFKVRAIAGHPIAGVRTLPIFQVGAR